MYDRELFGRIRFNEIAYSPFVYGNLPWRQYKGWREWTNTDDSNLRSYVEKNYGIKSSDKIMDALANVCSKYTVNPIKAMLETCHDNWDGNKHVENLLPNMLGAEKSEYTTAVMRLIMMGAVARVYHPGCKFDYMMVLVSDQGIGKSTFLRLLCINDAWFNDNFSTLDGDKAVEKLRGMWIVELAELQATKRTKDVETIKAFITSRVDTYRTPYARRTEQRPRMCILCGTSNPTDFLTDRTGNRRFLPITCGINSAKFDMFADEAATKMEFAQAWGEIMDEYLRKGGRISLVLPKRLQREAINMQERYMEEDPRIGIIQEWLDKTEHSRVCSMMLWREALKIEYAEPRAADIRAIHDIMRNAVAGWLPVGRQRCGDYGVQRCYEKVAKFEEVTENEEKQLPFD
jgi:predicted P-loop ATPase